jgi:secondary thiamine-phosphate synthase enzyme
MRQAIQTIEVDTNGQGFYDMTPSVMAFTHAQQIDAGLLTLFCRHSSASLIIQENADPSALRDLKAFFGRLAPEDAALYEHATEGSDDMPAHIRAALTQTSLAIPIGYGVPMLGQWQGVFLFEHRRQAHRREIVLHLIGE